MINDYKKLIIEKLIGIGNDSVVCALIFIRMAERLYGDSIYQCVHTDVYSEAIIEVLLALSEKHPFIKSWINDIKETELDDKLMGECIDLLSNTVSNDTDLIIIYEQYMSRIIPKIKDSVSGDLYTPKAVIQFLVDSLNMKDGKLYDPCCGSGSMLVCAAQKLKKSKLELYAQTNTTQSYNISQMNFFLNGLNVNMGKKPDNTLLNDQYKGMKFDYIMINPPFNQSKWYEDAFVYEDERWIYGVPPKSNANFAWLQSVIYSLDKHGKATVIMPNSSLTSVNYRESSIRTQIIESGIVESIITFPGDFFYATKVPFCVWVLNKARKDNTNILFVDIPTAMPTLNKKSNIDEYKILVDTILLFRNQEKIERHNGFEVVGLDDIRKADYILSPNIYMKHTLIKSHAKKRDMSGLRQHISEIKRIIDNRPLIGALEQWLSVTFDDIRWSKYKLTDIYDTFGGLNRSPYQKSPEFINKCGFLNTKAIIKNPVVPDVLPEMVEVSKDEAVKYSIHCGDVILNRTSENVKQLGCACVALNDSKAVYNGFAKRLRPNKLNDIDLFYIAGYFRTAVYRYEVERVATVFTTRISLNNQQLDNIYVYCPPVEIQKKIGNTLSLLFSTIQDNKNEEKQTLLEETFEIFIDEVISNPILSQETNK